jgi:cell wall-associated NlpC family hydrolase
MIIATARNYLGTPYHHLGRVKGIGIDCLGLIICVCRDLGLPYRDRPTYSRYATGVNLFAEFEEQCQPSVRGEGKILIFAMRKVANHCGIEATLGGEPSVIHALGPSASFGKRKSPAYCVEHHLDEWWESKIVGVYEFPNGN